MISRFSISTVPVGNNGARIGICGLPGRDGDLRGDLTIVAAWKPEIVVSMTTRAEMERCGSGGLGSLLRDAGIAWEHLPIGNLGGPEGDSAARWPDLGKKLHAILDSGGGVVLHCRGGHGRSGMIALRLLVERGERIAVALDRIRDARPGAVESEEQLSWATKFWN